MFEANSKAQHRLYGEVTIVGGPFESLAVHFYAIKAPGHTGIPKLVSAGTLKAIPLRPKFSKDDFAIFEGQRVRLLLDIRQGAGAFAGQDMAFVEYVSGPEAGRARSLLVTHLAPLSGPRPGPIRAAVSAAPIRVGDLVRVTKDDPDVCAGEFVGKIGRVIEINGPGSRLPYRVRFDADQGARHSEWNVKAVEHAGVRPRTVTIGLRPYDLGATYKDRDGDVWTAVNPGTADADPLMKSSSMLSHRLLSAVVRSYGPLRKV